MQEIIQNVKPDYRKIFIFGKNYNEEFGILVGEANISIFNSRLYYKTRLK